MRGPTLTHLYSIMIGPTFILAKGHRVGIYFCFFKVIVRFYFKQRSHLDLEQGVLLAQGHCQQV